MADLRERLEAAILDLQRTRDRVRFTVEDESYERYIATLREVLAHPEKLSSPSATGATSEFVSVPREPTLAMWDAAWKSIGLPYRAKLSLHEIKTLFDKFHAAMLAAAPAPAEPVADRLADSNYRAAFLSGWQACRRGDDRALEAVQNRVGSLQDYIDAAPTAPRVEAGATGWIAAHESGRIHHFSIADGWTVEVVTK